MPASSAGDSNSHSSLRPAGVRFSKPRRVRTRCSPDGARMRISTEDVLSATAAWTARAAASTSSPVASSAPASLASAPTGASSVSSPISPCHAAAFSPADHRLSLPRRRAVVVDCEHSMHCSDSDFCLMGRPVG